MFQALQCCKSSIFIFFSQSMQRYLCWTHKSTWHYRETNYTLRDVCFWSLTSWNYPLHFAHACHLQESSVTLPACSLHPWILVDGSRAAHPWLGCPSCESWVELWKQKWISCQPCHCSPTSHCLLSEMRCWPDRFTSGCSHPSLHSPKGADWKTSLSLCVCQCFKDGFYIHLLPDGD